MKPTVTKTLVASAVALLISGCGGGGSDAADPPVQGDGPDLQVTGTAATGLAMAGSNVDVKCAAGTGSATTDGNGTFTVTVTDGALPCMIKVTGEVDGKRITLHSVTEAASGDGTTATANVTPLTEMIVAQLTGSMPGDLFESFDASSSSRVTQAELASATSAVISALRTATGIDLGDIDPFKSPLVAATSAAPGQGNAYDQLLDQLKETLPTESLPLIVNQIAAAAGSAGAGDTPAPVTLGDIMTGVAGGSLEGCPAAVSGKYRTIDYFGRTFVRHFDFKSGKVTRGDDGQPLFDITADPEVACKFTAAGTVDGVQSKHEFVIGTSGAGAYRSQNLTSGGSTIGYVFPVQAHSFSAITGTWNYLQSGIIPGDPLGHFPGQFVIDDNRQVAACDYRPEADFGCETDEDLELSVTDRSDGGFNFVEAVGSGAQLFGYRPPNGELTIFGTTNPAGLSQDDVVRTSLLITRPRALALPEVGTVSKYSNLRMFRTPDAILTNEVESDATVAVAVDTDEEWFTRKRESNGYEDVIEINHPADGFRFRQGGGWEGSVHPPMVQLPVPALGITASFNYDPSPPAQHFYAISVGRQ